MGTRISTNNKTDVLAIPLFRGNAIMLSEY